MRLASTQPDAVGLVPPSRGETNPGLGDQMADANKPTHCPDGHDERSWVDLVGEPCDDFWHGGLRMAAMAAREWLDGVVAASFNSTLGQVYLPSSTGLPLGLDATSVDPSQAYLILARARRADNPTNAVYIGLVGQAVTGQWRGLTGFYLPYCGTCQGIDDCVADILDWMPQEAIALDPQRLPEAIRPAEDWFDDRMLLGIKPNGTGLGAGESTWRTWRPEALPDPADGALVCCGPMMAGMANIVFTDSPADDMPGILAAIAAQMDDPAGEPVATVRPGNTALLLASAGGLRSHEDGRGTVSGSVRGPVWRTKVPADWGVFYLDPADSGDPGGPGAAGISRSIHGTARRLRAEHRLGIPGASMTFHYWPTGPGVIAWRHLVQLRERSIRKG